MEMVIMCIVGFFMLIIGVTAFWQYFKSHEMVIGDLNTSITTWFGILVGYLILSYIITVYITAAIMYVLKFLASIIPWIICIVAVITIIGLAAYVYSQKNEQENFDARPYYIGITLIAIIAAVIFGLALYSSSNDKALPTQNKVSTVDDNQKSTQNKLSNVNDNQKAMQNDNHSINTKQIKPKSQTTNDDSNLKAAAQELSHYNIKGDVTATSYGHNTKGFLAKYGESMLAFCDKVNNRGVTIWPANTAQEIANYKGSSNKKIHFTLHISNANKDKDSVHGRWSNNDHYFPIEVEFKFENGKHIPGMIKSGLGEQPSNYDKYLYETKNIEMVNLIIEEAAHLK